MTITAGIDGGYEREIASNLGWSEFSDWICTLDLDDYGKIIQLIEHGLTQEGPRAAKELAAALKDKSTPADMKPVGKGLLSVIRKAKGDDVVYISNGIVFTDDKPRRKRKK